MIDSSIKLPEDLAVLNDIAILNINRAEIEKTADAYADAAISLQDLAAKLIKYGYEKYWVLALDLYDYYATLSLDTFEEEYAEFKSKQFWIEQLSKINWSN